MLALRSLQKNTEKQKQYERTRKELLLQSGNEILRDMRELFPEQCGRDNVIDPAMQRGADEKGSEQQDESVGDADTMRGVCEEIGGGAWMKLISWICRICRIGNKNTTLREEELYMQVSSNTKVCIGRNGKVYREFVEEWGALDFGEASPVSVTFEKEIRELALKTRQTRDGKELESFCTEQIENGNSYPGINHILHQEGLCLVENDVDTNMRTIPFFNLKQIIHDDDGIYCDSISNPMIMQLNSAVEFYAMP